MTNETARIVVAATKRFSELEVRIIKLERSRIAFKYAFIGYALISLALQWWWLS